MTFGRYYRAKSGPVSGVGKAAEALTCHCGRTALYMVSTGKKDRFIGFCEKHREEANDAQRARSGVTQQNRERDKDRQHAWKGLGVRKDMSKHKHGPWNSQKKLSDK